MLYILFQGSGSVNVIVVQRSGSIIMPHDYNEEKHIGEKYNKKTKQDANTVPRGRIVKITSNF